MSWMYTTLSIIFHYTDSNETGVYCSGSVVLPFSYKDFTLAVLRIRGNLELKGRLIILHSGLVNSSTPSFKNLPRISSHHYASLRSIFTSILQISSHLVFLNLRELEGIFMAE